MVRMLMTLPPHRLRAVGRALIEGEEPVFRRMPLTSEIGTPDTEGRSRASLPTASGSSMWSRSYGHSGPHLDNTVRRCVGSMNGLVGFAGATAQDVGRVEAGGRWNGVAVKATCWRLMTARSSGSASHRSNSLRLAGWPAGRQAIDRFMNLTAGWNRGVPGIK